MPCSLNIFNQFSLLKFVVIEFHVTFIGKAFQSLNESSLLNANICSFSDEILKE